MILFPNWCVIAAIVVVCQAAPVKEQPDAKTNSTEMPDFMLDPALVKGYLDKSNNYEGFIDYLRTLDKDTAIKLATAVVDQAMDDDDEDSDDEADDTTDMEEEEEEEDDDDDDVLDGNFEHILGDIGTNEDDEHEWSDAVATNEEKDESDDLPIDDIKTSLDRWFRAQLAKGEANPIDVLTRMLYYISSDRLPPNRKAHVMDLLANFEPQLFDALINKQDDAPSKATLQKAVDMVKPIRLAKQKLMESLPRRNEPLSVVHHNN